MESIKIKAFVLPRWENNTMNSVDYDFGGYFIGEDTNEPILEIDFKNRKIITKITTRASIFSFGLYGSRQTYNFDDLEILSCKFERTKLSGDNVKQLVKIAKESADLQQEQIDGYKSKSRFKW